MMVDCNPVARRGKHSVISTDVAIKVKEDDFEKVLKVVKMGRLRKKAPGLRRGKLRQGAQILRSEAYFVVRRNDEG